MTEQTERENALRVLGGVLHNPLNRDRAEKAISEQASSARGIGAPTNSYYRYLVYEVVDSLADAASADDAASASVRVFRDLRAGRHGCRHTRFEYIRRIFEEEENFLCHPPDIDEGVIACSRCGSNKTYSFTKQVRRADESATVFVRCSKCRHSFRIG